MYAWWCINIKLFVPSGYGLSLFLAAFTKVFLVVIKVFIEIIHLWAVSILLPVDWFGALFTKFAFSSWEIVEGAQS